MAALDSRTCITFSCADRTCSMARPNVNCDHLSYSVNRGMHAEYAKYTQNNAASCMAVVTCEIEARVTCVWWQVWRRHQMTIVALVIAVSA